MSIKGERSHRSIVKKYIVSLAIGGAGAAALASVAFATPGLNAVGTIVARAAFLDSVDFKIKITEDSTGHRRRHHHEREVIRVRDAGDTVMQQIVIGPGGHTGWHSHPGPAIALVKSGELTLYSSDDPTCTGRVFRAGQAFVDSGQGHVHLARNETTQNTEVWVTYLDVPPVTGSVRIDVPDPGTCRF